MLPFSTAHPYEVACLILSLLAFVMSAIIFVSKINDLIDLTRKKRNGYVKFTLIDRIRARGFVMVICTILINSSISGVNNMVEPTAQTLNWLVAGISISLLIIVDSFLIYRKRLTQFVMIAEYEAEELILLKIREGKIDPSALETHVTKTHKTESVTGSKLSEPLVTESHTVVETSVEKNGHEPSIT